MRRLVLLACLLAAGLCSPVLATDIYVDNLVGNDVADGLVVRPIEAGSGPVRTLRRAMKIAEFGDRVILTRTGAVYYDSLSLTSSRNSGTKNFPFTIIGNGATLSGLRALPPQGWQSAGTDLWKLTFTRKGFYRLMRDGQPLKEVIAEPGTDPLSSLTAGEWTAHQGSVYFRSEEGEPPTTQSFAYAADQTGLSLYHVENVRIVDLTLRDFRFDGIHAQNLCRGVTLENVNCLNNGRAGIAVSGTSKVEIKGGSVAGNGRFSLRIADQAEANLRDSSLDVDPAIIP